MSSLAQVQQHAGGKAGRQADAHAHATHNHNSFFLMPRRRYLELQAASFQSYLCSADSPLAASTLTSAPQAAVDPAAAWTRPGPYLVLDSPTATAAAAAAGSGVDAGALLRSWGCEASQSFLLLDIKWSLQAQVGRVCVSPAHRSGSWSCRQRWTCAPMSPCCSTAAPSMCPAAAVAAAVCVRHCAHFVPGVPAGPWLLPDPQ